MARQILKRDISHVLAAAEQWIRTCLIEDRSVFLTDCRWTASLTDEVYRAFVEHPDYGDDDFMTKLKGQMKSGSPSAKQLMAEMLWALLLFSSNMKARTKRHQVREIWGMSGQQLGDGHRLLDDKVLVGIGSGGPGFNNYRPNELEFLISLVRDLKQRNESKRREILTDYDAFFDWIDSVPRKGSRQFRHMLRFFAFPDRVERISSNNDRRKILEAFGSGSAREMAGWSDRQLDEKLMELRTRLQEAQPSAVLDFYEPPLSERWSRDRRIKTVAGEVTVTVPGDDTEVEDREAGAAEAKAPEARQSIQIQARLARIGAMMGFKVWIPRADRPRKGAGAGKRACRISRRSSLELRNYDPRHH
jgi:5-methylcytosine-specific restriction protein B